MSEPRLRDVDALRRRLTGAVVAPGDSGWDVARQAWNLAADQHPAAVVIADGAQDVTATLAFATRTGLHVAPQATGHGAPSLPALDDAILLRTRGMTGVAVDGPRRRARVGAGTPWSAVVGPAADEGLVALHGFSGGVGVAGYTLGGGLGWLGRSHGLACNAVTALEVVLADGRPLRVDAETEPDLFWALRGGGGAAAIVTALELELFPLREAFAGQLAWPLAQAADVVEAYRSWTSGLPDELTSALRLMRYPPLPELPTELRGRAFVIVTLAFGGDAAAGEELVAALRGVGSPATDTLATIPARDLPEVAGDPPGPLAGIGDSALLRALDVDAVLEIGGPEAQTALTSVEVRHLDGALGRSAPEHGAADAIDAPFLFDAVGTPVDAASADGLRNELDRAKELLAASATGRTLLTFAEREPRLDDCLPGETAARVREITRRFDPGGIIRANHAVGA